MAAASSPAAGENVRSGVQGPPEVMLTVAEVAEILGVSEDWIRHHAGGKRRPALHGAKVGKFWRFRRCWIENLIASVENYDQ